jgi:tetratricopeptide (TPR) repeat protein
VENSIFLNLCLRLSLALCLFGCAPQIDHARVCDELVAKAINSENEHDYAQADKLLQSAIVSAEASDNSSLKPRVMQQQIKVWLLEGKAKEAEAAARQSIAIYDQLLQAKMASPLRVTLTEDQARSKMLLADAWIAQKRYDEAKELLRKTNEDLKDVCASFVLQSIVADKFVEANKLSDKPDKDTIEGFEENAMYKLKASNDRRNGFGLLVAHKCKESLQAYRIAAAEEEKEGASIQKSGIHLAASLADLSVAEFLSGEKNQAEKDVARAAQLIKNDVQNTHTYAKVLVAQAVVCRNPAGSASFIKKAGQNDAPIVYYSLSPIAFSKEWDLATRLRMLDLLWVVAPKLDNFLYKAIVAGRIEIFQQEKKYDEICSWLQENARSKLWPRPADKSFFLEQAGNVRRNMVLSEGKKK